MLLANMDKVFASETPSRQSPIPFYDESPNSFYQYTALTFFTIRSGLSVSLMTREEKDDDPSAETRLTRNQGMLNQYDHAIRYEESRIEALQAKLMKKAKYKEKVASDLDEIFQREYKKINRTAILAKDKYAFVYEEDCSEPLISIVDNVELQDMQKRHDKIIRDAITRFEIYAARNIAKQDYHGNRIIEYYKSRAYVQAVIDDLTIEAAEESAAIASRRFS